MNNVICIAAVSVRMSSLEYKKTTTIQLIVERSYSVIYQRLATYKESSKKDGDPTSWPPSRSWEKRIKKYRINIFSVQYSFIVESKYFYMCTCVSLCDGTANYIGCLQIFFLSDNNIQSEYVQSRFSKTTVKKGEDPLGLQYENLEKLSS